MPKTNISDTKDTKDTKDRTEKKKKDEFISVRVESVIKSELLKIAENNDRPMSWVVNKILVEYVNSDKPKIL